MVTVDQEKLQTTTTMELTMDYHHISKAKDTLLKFIDEVEKHCSEDPRIERIKSSIAFMGEGLAHIQNELIRRAH